MTPNQFSQAILTWYKKHGRQTLPWRQEINAYRVWISEIMLQQTQVATVLPYFTRFMAKFPTLEKLATSPIDDVLTLWAGLGYYSRARNLHKAAIFLFERWSGEFPNDVARLQQLPGIGRSTAGAIAAIVFETKAPILDGNVKRVLARFAAVEGWPGKNDVAEKLWRLADEYTPKKNVGDYTQAMMDLGATVCTRHQPKCNLCPLQESCIAKHTHSQTAYPGKKPKKNVPQRSLTLLLLHDQQQKILLEKRPPVGIWGGLWSLPECDSLGDIATWCKTHYHCQIDHHQSWPTFRHTLSHMHLDITPVVISVKDWQPPLMDNSLYCWHALSKIAEKAFPAPVTRLLRQLQDLNY